jgi:hypothetical protein
MLKRPFVITCVLLSLPVLAGLVGAAQASLSRSALNRIVGGCDECNQWVPCTHCDEWWVKCTTTFLYVECLFTGKNPNLGCGYCYNWGANCGSFRACYDEVCDDCDPNSGPCSGCNQMMIDPPYETCPGW